MGDYDINGTIFYNAALKLGAFHKHTPPFVRDALALIDAPVGADERMALLWRERVKNARELARAGLVHALAVRPRVISARVNHPVAKTTHSVKFITPPADEALWRAIAAHAATEFELAATISNGELPDSWMTTLTLARGDLLCFVDGIEAPLSAPPDPLAATAWLVFAHRAQIDPWLWVLFRGQTREGLLDLAQHSRAARQGAAAIGVDLDPVLFWRFDGLSDWSPEPLAEPHLLRQLRTSRSGVRAGRAHVDGLLRRAVTRRRQR
jgi:hypothetical protein